MRRNILSLLTLPLLFAGAGAMSVETRDGLRVDAALPAALGPLRIDGQPLGAGAGGFTLTDPRTGQPPAPGAFTLTAQATAQGERLYLRGEVTAAGEQETVCLLQARIPVGADGWLFWDGLNRARPIRPGASLVLAAYPCACVTSPDRRLGLAVGLTPDPLQPAHFVYDPRDHTLVVNWQLGFTPLARPELRMRAPFAIELYRTAPGWAFRSALDRYMGFHPEKFARRATYEGLWEFATSTDSLPNPQHYAYNEGGPPATLDVPRGIHTFPYTCTGDLTIALPPSWGTPKTYEEMLERLDRWAKLPRLADWERLSDYEVSSEQPHSGERSLRLSVAKPGEAQQVRQVIVLGQKRVDPVTVSVWVRTQDVTGGADSNNGLWLDLLMADGSFQFGRTAPAPVGTHGWQKLSITVGQDQPVQEIRLYLLFRGAHTGSVWFDDLSVTCASQPDKNLARTAGFESTGPPPEVQFLRDNAMYDAKGHMRWFPDTWGGADVGPASPINWLRFSMLVNADQVNPEGRTTEADKDLTRIADIFRDHPQCAGIYMDGTSAGTTVTYEYRPEFLRFFRDPFLYENGVFKPCGNGMASVVRYVDEYKRRFPGKLAFGNVWATNRMMPVNMALDVPGYESSKWYDLDYADYYRAAAGNKPGLYLNYFRLGQQLDTREGGERFFRYATAYGLFPSIGRFTDEAYQKFGDLQHLYVPIVNHLFRAGWQPVTAADAGDAELRVERYGTRLPLYLTVLNPTGNPRRATLSIDAGALGLSGPPVAVAMDTSATLPLQRQGERLGVPLALGPQDVAVVALLPADGLSAWYREQAAERLAGAALVHASTPPTSVCATLGRRVGHLSGSPASVARQLHDVLTEIARLREQSAQLADDLKRVSYRRELAEAERLIGESLLADVGGRAGWTGATIVPVDQPLAPAAAVSGPVTAGPLRYAAGCLVEPAGAKLVAAEPGSAALRAVPGQAGVTFVTNLAFTDAGGHPRTVTRRGCGWFSPVGELTARFDAATRELTATVRNLDAAPREFNLALTAPAGVTLTPSSSRLALQGGAAATVTVRVEFAATAPSRAPLHLVLRPGADLPPLVESTVDALNIKPLEPGNLALAATGAQVAVDSAYYAYEAKPLTDGVVVPTGVPFNQAAWAAAETLADHWVQLTWPQAQQVGRVEVYWNLENDVTWTSQHVLVQVKEGDTWRTVADVRPAAGEPVTTLRCEPVSTASLRLLQPKGEGPATRPNIMWLREVAVYAR